MTDEERKRWEEQFRKEVNEEHQRLNEFLEARANQDEAMVRQAELAELRRKVREQVWQEKGYVRYVDSRGSETWVTPEEYETRMRRRQARHSTWAELVYSDLGREVMIGLGILAIAVFVGLLLSLKLK